MHTPHLLQGDVSQWLDDQSHGHSAATEEVFGAGNGVHGSTHVAGTAVACRKRRRVRIDGRKRRKKGGGERKKRREKGEVEEKIRACLSRDTKVIITTYHRLVQ